MHDSPNTPGAAAVAKTLPDAPNSTAAVTTPTPSPIASSTTLTDAIDPTTLDLTPPPVTPHHVATPNAGAPPPSAAMLGFLEFAQSLFVASSPEAPAVIATRTNILTVVASAAACRSQTALPRGQASLTHTGPPRMKFPPLELPRVTVVRAIVSKVSQAEYMSLDEWLGEEVEIAVPTPTDNMTAPPRPNLVAIHYHSVLVNPNVHRLFTCFLTRCREVKVPPSLSLFLHLFHVGQTGP
nr:hypothetical protein Iba_chr03aCG7160 [Ipomoea batatas]